MENQEQTSVFGLQLDESTKNNLRTMASWALIIVVTTLIKYVVGFVQYFKEKNEFASSYTEENGYSDTFGEADRETLPFLIIGTIIGLLLCYFLYKFSDLTKKGIDTHNQVSLNDGIGHLRNYFLTLGIVAIIVIALFLIGMLFFSTMIG